MESVIQFYVDMQKYDYGKNYSAVPQSQSSAYLATSCSFANIDLESLFASVYSMC